MLVLTRKVKQSIVIALEDGTEIEIRLVKVDGDIAKLAIDAPKEISIYRKEILDSIKASNLEAAMDSKAPGATEALQQAKKYKVSSKSPE